MVGATAHATVTDAIVSAPLKATRSGPAQLSLVIADPDRALTKSGGMLDRQLDMLMDDGIDVRIGGIWWRVVGAEPDEDGGQLTILTEDRSGVWLRRPDKRIRAVRGRVARAQFIHRLHREAGGGIDLWVPELHDRQPIAAAEQGSRSAAGSSAADWDNLPAKVRIYNGYVEMTPARRDVAATLLGVAARLRAPRKACLALAMAGLVESHLTNTGWSDGSNMSRGVLQARPGISAGPRGTITATQANDIGYMAECFLRDPGFGSRGGALKLVRQHPEWTAGQIAQEVERSGYPGRYDDSREGAEAILKAYRGGALDTDDAGSEPSGGGTYTFERGSDGQRENSLATAVRLAREVPWNYWIYGNSGVFASDAELIRAPTTLVLERDNPAVLRMPWRLDVRHSASQMSAEILVDRLPEPGQVALVRDEAMASGRWLIDSVECDLAQPVESVDGERLLQATVQLARARRKGKEPAAQAKASRGRSEGGGASPSGGAPNANGLVYPLERRGKLIGTPYAGTHTLGNWQSDNAVDLGVPNGTGVFATQGGRVTQVRGSYQGGADRFDGFRVTIAGDNNEWFYTHLSKANVQPGQSVTAGQLIGRSGSANGVPHLHLGCKTGNPVKLLGLQ